MEMVPFPIYGHFGTKIFEESFQDRKFTKFFGCSTSALGDYEVVYSVWWMPLDGVLLGGVWVWQRRQRVRAAHK